MLRTTRSWQIQVKATQSRMIAVTPFALWRVQAPQRFFSAEPIKRRATRSGSQITRDQLLCSGLHRSICGLLNMLGKTCCRPRLPQEHGAIRHITRDRKCPSRRNDDLDIWPPLTNLLGQFVTIRPRWHLDIREEHLNVGPRLQNAQGFRDVLCLDDFEATILKEIRNQHSDQNFIFANQHERLFRLGAGHGIRLSHEVTHRHWISTNSTSHDGLSFLIACIASGSDCWITFPAHRLLVHAPFEPAFRYRNRTVAWHHFMPALLAGRGGHSSG